MPFAFRHCENLSSVALGSSIKYIRESAFEECRQLESIIIPDSVVKIEAYAFNSCDNLTEIYFGQGLNNIHGAFIRTTSGPEPIFYAEDGKTELDFENINDFRGYWFKGINVSNMIRVGQIMKHHVTYIVDGGSERAPIQNDLDEGTKFIIAQYSGTKSGFTFGGWSCDGITYNGEDSIVMGKSNIILTAIWNPSMGYRIDFVLNGGSCTTDSMRTETNGKLQSIPTPTWGGRNFEGWYTDPIGGDRIDTSTVFSENSIVYAHWSTPGTCTVVFNVNDGTGSNDKLQTDLDGKLSILPTLHRDGYTFGGWSVTPNGNTQIDVNHTYSVDTTLYAIWIPAESGDADKTTDGDDSDATEESNNSESERPTYPYIGLIVIIILAGIVVALRKR